MGLGMILPSALVEVSELNTESQGTVLLLGKRTGALAGIEIIR